MWPLRPLKRTIWMIIAGIIGSILIVIGGVFLAAALDLADFSGYAGTLGAADAQAGATPVARLVLIQVLLPSLLPLGNWPALLISGVIWGLWHSPIILLGYNFNQPNLFGLAMMFGGTILFGTLLGWLRLRTGFVWPAVFAHGAFNAAGGFLMLVIAANSAADPVAAGPLGWATWIVMALVIVVLWRTGQFSIQPGLEYRLRQERATP